MPGKAVSTTAGSAAVKPGVDFEEPIVILTRFGTSAAASFS
jgi:hypothetical protein